MIEAKLHSIETMGLADGPGIRTVFFLQGCPLRCSYCHNPDSQSMFSKSRITPEEVVKIARRYKSYYKRSGGGVTFSGGEPLLQGEFLLKTIKMLKAEGISTAIDTSGYGDLRFYKEILENVDIVLLDIKHYDNKGYKNITQKSISGFYKFLSSLEYFHGILWLRHVMIPTITDNIESIDKIFNNISYLAEKIYKFEILPYHTMGLDKYEKLNLEYKLKEVPEMDKKKAKDFEVILSNMLEKEKYNLSKNRKIV